MVVDVQSLQRLLLAVRRVETTCLDSGVDFTQIPFTKVITSPSLQPPDFGWLDNYLSDTSLDPQRQDRIRTTTLATADKIRLGVLTAYEELVTRVFSLARFARLSDRDHQRALCVLHEQLYQRQLNRLQTSVLETLDRCGAKLLTTRKTSGYDSHVVRILETAYAHSNTLNTAECELVASAARITYEQFQNKRNRTKHLNPTPKPPSETKQLKPGRVASHSELQSRVTPPVVDGRRVASLPKRAKGKAKVEVVDVAPAPVHLDAPAAAGGRNIRSLPKRGQAISAPAPPAQASIATTSPALDSAAHLIPTGTNIPSPAPSMARSLSGSSEASFASASSLDSIPHGGGFTSPLQPPTAGTTTISMPWQSTSTGVLALMTGSGMDFNFIPPTPINSTFTGSGWTDSPVDMTREDFFANLATMTPANVLPAELNTDPALGTAFSQSGEGWSFDPFGNFEGDLASILSSGFNLSGNTTLAGSPQWTVSSSPGEEKASSYSPDNSNVGLITPEKVGRNLGGQMGLEMDMDWSSILGSLGLSEDPLAALESLIAESVANTPGTDVSALAAPLDPVTAVDQQPSKSDSTVKQDDKTFDFIADIVDSSSDSSLTPLSSPDANPIDASPRSSIHSASSTSFNLQNEARTTSVGAVGAVGAVGPANPAEQLLTLQTDPPQQFLCATLSLLHPPSEPFSTSSLNTSLAPSPSPSCATPLAYTASAISSSPYVTPRSDTTTPPVSDEDKWISGVLAFDCGAAEWESYADKLVPGGAWDFGGMFGEMEGMQAVV
ncbi:hypothetical protein EHS25_002314 [Saitozyma podzolica]|uniref:Uncharacterized protein n=1 Tax=Saitozyma podzolica TaxID=1890683 RepID=A0A427YDR4_9TREE|nr:hypothetical protein EHS25_002314 [Saitozyma podzolica]